MKEGCEKQTAVLTEDRRSREAFERGELYSPGAICNTLDEASPEYIDRLVSRKLEIILRHYESGLVVDLCCATGGHLLALSDRIDRGIGLDFSSRYLGVAASDACFARVRNLTFAGANARQLPLKTDSVSLLYSLSSLYVIPQIDDIIEEVARVLRPDGRCVLDLGNRWSLNAICVRSYPEIACSHHLSVRKMKRLCRAAGLRILEHRAFQLLPLWADRPGWLLPLLHPWWKNAMRRRVRGRMVDEWASNLPLLKSLAFRHVIVCEKTRPAPPARGASA